MPVYAAAAAKVRIHSNPEGDNGCKAAGREEVEGELAVARCDAPEVFKAREGNRYSPGVAVVCPSPELAEKIYEIAAMLRELEARKTDLEADLCQSGAQTFIDIHPNVTELYRRKVGELQVLLADEATRMNAVDRVRTLIERIEVHSGAKRGQPEVVLVGALASILDYACSETRAAASGGGGGRVLMVAGARNQRYLPKLSSVFLPPLTSPEPSGMLSKNDTRGLEGWGPPCAKICR